MLFKCLWFAGIVNLNRVIGKHTGRKIPTYISFSLFGVVAFVLFGVAAFGAPIKGIFGIAGVQPPVIPIPDTLTEITMTTPASLQSLQSGTLYSTGGTGIGNTRALSSTDLGANWSELGTDANLIDLAEVPSTGTLIAARVVSGTWSVLRSTNGGASFSTAYTSPTSGTTNPGRRLIAIDSSENIYIALYRNIVRSTNDGVSFTSLDTGATRCTGTAGIALDPPGTIIITGDNNTGCGSGPPSPMAMRVSIDSGSSWSSVAISTGWNVNGYFVPYYSVTDGSFLVAVQREGSVDTSHIYRSTDGVSWSITTSPPTFFNNTVQTITIGTFGNSQGTQLYLATTRSAAGVPLAVYSMQLPNGSWNTIDAGTIGISSTSLTPILRQANDLYFGSIDTGPVRKWWKLHD